MPNGAKVAIEECRYPASNFTIKDFERAKWMIEKMGARKPKLIYIAGKVSGRKRVEYIRQFAKYQEELEDQGFQVWNPVEQVVIAQIELCSWEVIMKFCIANMVVCDEVHMLPGWNESRGAIIERDLAMRLGMKVVYVG